jgi:peptidyl-prolyl cis-trans isomerase C
MRLPMISRLMLSVAMVALPMQAMAQDTAKPAAAPAMSKPAAAKPAAAAKAEQPRPASATDYVVLKVNGDNVMRSEVLELWESMFEGKAVPDFDAQEASIKQNVLTGLVSERLVLQEANKAGLDKDPEVARRLKMLQNQLVIQEWMARQTKDKLTDDALKAYYDKQVKKAEGQKEAHIRHILVKTAEEAKDVYNRLKKGDSFEDVAKELSQDQASGTRGGDIGWVSRERVVPEFADAAFKLKKNEISRPVKSAFGWHVIQMLDTRTLQPKSFTEVRYDIGQQALGDATRDIVGGLLKKADIEHLSANGEKLPFDRTLPGTEAQR